MSSGTVTPTVLLERDDALTSLGEALEEVRTGTGRVMLVAGEASPSGTPTS